MNLHGIASGLVSAVNPSMLCLVQPSIGYSTLASGQQVPAYGDPFYPMAQVQSLGTDDLRQLDALNIQGSSRKIYLSGSVDAIVRVSKKGGDLVTLPDGSVWLTTHVLENWTTSGWCCVSVTLQDQKGAINALDFSDPANSMYAPLVG